MQSDFISFVERVWQHRYIYRRVDPCPWAQRVLSEMELSRLHPGSVSPPELNSHIMESLFFSMSVYEPTQDAVLQDLHRRFGKVEPLISYGFEEHDGKQAIFVARSPTGRIIVACRGTAGFRDIVADLKYLQSRLSFVKGAAHWGFAERAESVPIDFFCKLLGAGEELIFTGHSLGGAVASLLSLRVLQSSKGLYDEQVHCITFGCPLFASCRLAELINSNYKEVFTHVVSRRDVVPKILPFISTLQKLVYADEDHLEGLFVLKTALSFLPGIPLASLISGIERRVPSLLKFLFRGFMKLAYPSGMTGSYAFAGHIVMLDTEGPLERSLVLASADDMNAWHSQLGFAFGTGFDVTMIDEHMLECYHNGILRSLSHVRVRRDILFSGPSLTSFRLQPEYAQLGLHNVIDQVNRESCGGTRSQGFATKGCDLDGKPQQQQSFVIRFTPPEGDVSMDCQIQFRCDTSDGESSSSIVVKQSSRQQEGGDFSGFNPRTSGTEGGTSSSRSFTRTLSAEQHTFARSLGRSKSRRLERSKSSGWAPRSELGASNVLARTTKELIIRCRACTHLRMHMNITACCHKAPRKGFGFAWLLGTIGRLSRHLRILDNVCYLTFVRILVGNLVG